MTPSLLSISATLMRQVGQATDDFGAGYAYLQRAVMPGEEIRRRTSDLEKRWSF